jgi:hypothetical protein
MTHKSNGVELIAAERARQISAEGWTPEHDDTHRLAQMTLAAASYAWLAASQVRLGGSCLNPAPKGMYWPWADEWWKPSANPIRNLVKAGALIAAEIDRLQRKASK